MKRILPFQHFLCDVWHDMGHGELNIATGDIAISQSAFFPDPNTVERPHDRVGQTVLFPSSLREIFGRQFLKTICRSWGRTAALSTFRRRELGCVLENHARRHDCYFFSSVMAML